MGCVFLAGCVFLRATPPGPPAPTPDTARGELHAAQLMAASLFIRQAGKEEMQKMDGVFAELEVKYPQDAAIVNGHAEFLWSTEDRDRAVEKWRAAEKLDPNFAPALDHLGDVAFGLGEVKKAADYYARAVRIAPDNAAYHFGYANVVFLFRHDLHDATHADSDSLLDESLKHFAEASRLDPLNTNYARAFAETYYAIPKPDWSEALKAWRHLYDISPTKDFALLNLARVHMKLGNKPEARASLGEIQDPKFDRAKARLKGRIEVE